MNEFVGTLKGCEQRLSPPQIKDLSRIKKRYKKSTKRLFLFDYDGTLSEIVSHPDDAKPNDEILGLLKKLAEDGRNKVYIVTGRGYKNIGKWIPSKEIGIFAEHGMCHRVGGKWKIEKTDLSWKESAREIIDFFVERTPGSLKEEKDTSMCFHYRNCDPKIQKIQCSALKMILEKLLVYKRELDIIDGKFVLEIKANARNKGDAVRELMKGNYDFVMCAGDDETDESMFEAGSSIDHFHSILVGERNSRSKYTVSSPNDLLQFIRELL
jgi:trehalose 6-phosphate synthase/phosphatase